ncbi:hypothetical protein BDZ94DRAFT_1266893 [Collybia nuda]|uniref:DUF6534 domain-containing protein n=1 Tax=Collybia nuda TaxID=64659 RepID=A0A9P6CBW8_9AGAR|nr:hypothetical protein BDZ94DRAFT_1266893 [Collybia nuda]
MNFIPADIEKSTGPLLLGYILSWYLYGSLSVQVYYYYLAFPKDRPVLKGLVYGVLLIETTQSIFVVHDLFKIFASGYGNIVELRDPQFTWIIAPVMTGVVSCTVQAYFAHRIQIISGSKIPGFIILLLAFMQGICAIISGVQVHLGNDLTAVQAEALVSTTIWLVGSALCDVIISVFMVYFLSRRTTGFKETQVLVTRIMRLTIETGSLTATVAIIDVVLFLTFPEYSYHVAPALILGKLYSNTLVTSLNSRMVITDSRNNTPADETNLRRSEGMYMANVQRRQFLGIKSRPRKADTSVAINIERQVWKTEVPMNNLDSQERNDGTGAKIIIMEGLA